MGGLNDYLNELLSRIEIVEDDESPEPICDTCGTKGMVQLAVGERLVPCSDCDKGRNYQRDIMQRRSRRTELPQIYQHASLSDWLGKGLTPEQKFRELAHRTGKIVAFLTAQEFVRHPQHLISSKVVAKQTLKFVGDPPEWLLSIANDEADIIRRGFVLQGPVGTGKTWLAAAVMNDLTEQGEVVLYMRAQDIIQSLKDTWHSSEDEREIDVLNRYKTVPFLFIDDMNLELRGDTLLPHQKDYMEAIIRYRSNHQLRTFITCNINNAQFYDQWGSRIADVITADLQWVTMTGTAFRVTEQRWGDL